MFQGGEVTLQSFSCKFAGAEDGAIYSCSRRTHAQGWRRRPCRLEASYNISYKYIRND